MHSAAAYVGLRVCVRGRECGGGVGAAARRRSEPRLPHERVAESGRGARFSASRETRERTRVLRACMRKPTSFS